MADEQNIPLSVLRSYSPHPDKLDLTGLTQDEITHGIKSSKLPDYIRYKQYLTDTNEALAQLAEMIIQFAVNLGLDQDQTLDWARKLQQAVPQSEFDSWIATLLDGGPSIFVNTLSELQAKYPNGAAGVALVRETDPAKIYVWNGTSWEDFGAYQGIEVKDGSIAEDKIADKAVTPDKLSADLQNKITSNVENGHLIENAALALPIGTTRFNNTPSLIGGDVTEIKLNVAKAGTAKIKVVQKFTDTTFKVVSDQTVTLNKTGLVKLVSGTDYTPFTIQKDEYIAWRGVTAEIGYINGGSAYYATIEGAIGAEQTYTGVAITLAIAWSVGKDGTILKDIAELKDAVSKPFEIADGSIEPKQTTFFESGKNIFDKSKIIDGYYVNQVSGALQANPSHKASSPMPVESGATYVSAQFLQRYALYNDETFVSGGLNAYTVNIPTGANRLVVSSDGFDIDTLQIEKGTVATGYEPYGYKVKGVFLPTDDGYGGNQFVGDGAKKYRVVGANIRTPLAAGLPFELHDDAGHEPMGITSATIVGEGLRIGMPFTADKVISMNATPHVSMRNEGWEVATTGGLSVHEVHFYKNGVHVPASEVVLNGGSFWYSGVFLV